MGIPFTSYCRCRCAALSPTLDPDSLQRSPGQPAVSQKRDQNNLPPFCHKYYSGRGEALHGCGYRAQQCLVPAPKSAHITVLWRLSVNSPLNTARPHLSTFTQRTCTAAAHTRTCQTHDNALTARWSAVAPSQRPIR